MKKKPFLSVITVCYNNAEGLKKTFDSIRKIKTDNVEYIVNFPTHFYGLFDVELLEIVFVKDDVSDLFHICICMQS